MDFTEEMTPSGKLIKILLKKWQFLAFDKKGKSIYTDEEGKRLLHSVPLILFLGNSLDYNHDYEKNYQMLKIRDGKMILPFVDKKKNMVRYLFIDVDKNLDLVPVRMFRMNNVAEMVKNYDPNMRPDFIIIDDEITANDVVIILNRYKIDELNIIPAARSISRRTYYDDSDIDIRTNLNVMSDNPVYLAIAHLRSNDYSKIYQLLLDFELTALDTEYILNFINSRIRDLEGEKKNKDSDMLNEILNIYNFYHFLLKKSDDEVKGMVEMSGSLKEITSYRTLISKVKAQYPGNEEQILYTEYENIVIEKLEELKQSEKMEKRPS